MVGIALESVYMEFNVFDARRRRLFHPGNLPKLVGGRLRTASQHVVVTALSDINLHVKQGDRIGLIGHNGAGKSTLLRVLSGIYHPTRGKATITGRVSPIFDVSLGFDPDATGAENIAMLGLINGMSIAEIDAATPEIADFTGLGEYLHLPARIYSAGMLTRLQFAVATATQRRPDILIVDEGIGAGDAAFMEKADRRFSEFMSRPAALVLASHAQPTIERFCDRAIVLQQGSIAFDGSVPAAFAEYARIVGAA